MAAGGKRAGAGRKKGSTSKVTQDVRSLVDAIFAKHDPMVTAEALLTCGHPPTIAKVWQTLLEYRYGKPIQPVTGEGGGPLQVKIVSAIERPQRG